MKRYPSFLARCASHMASVSSWRWYGIIIAQQEDRMANAVPEETCAMWAWLPHGGRMLLLARPGAPRLEPDQS